MHLSYQTSQKILHLSHAESNENFNVYNHRSIDRHKPVNKHSYRFISRALESHTLCSKWSMVHRSKRIICTLRQIKSPRALQDGEQYFPPDSLQLRNECSAEKQNHHRGSGELLLLTRESAIFKTPVISASKTESYRERSRHISVCFPLSSAHTSPA